MTRKQLARFVKTRLKSCFNSNLQFMSDADECGFKIDDLGPVRKFSYNGGVGYEWQPVMNDGTTAILVEFGAYLFTPETDSPAARHFFAHDYPKIEYVKIEAA